MREQQVPHDFPKWEPIGGAPSTIPVIQFCLQKMHLIGSCLKVHSLLAFCKRARSANLDVGVTENVPSKCTNFTMGNSLGEHAQADVSAPPYFLRSRWQIQTTVQGWRFISIWHFAGEHETNNRQKKWFRICSISAVLREERRRKSEGTEGASPSPLLFWRSHFTISPKRCWEPPFSRELLLPYTWVHCSWPVGIALNVPCVTSFWSSVLL